MEGLAGLTLKYCAGVSSYFSWMGGLRPQALVELHGNRSRGQSGRRATPGCIRIGQSFQHELAPDLRRSNH